MAIVVLRVDLRQLVDWSIGQSFYEMIVASNKYQSSSYIKYKYNIYKLLLPAQTVTFMVCFNFLDFNCKQSAK